MNESAFAFALRTTELRRFESPRLAVPFEVEFSHDEALTTKLAMALGEPVVEQDLEAEHLLRLIARLALTGSSVPPIAVSKGQGPVPLETVDVLRLALGLSRLGEFPTTMDYGNDSAYLRTRAVIEQILELQHVHLEIREGERRREEETEITALSQILGLHGIAHGMSPDLGLSLFVDLLRKNRKVFAFPGNGNLLLGASAIGAAYQIAVPSNPILAIELALGGAVAYIVLKFGAAVGKHMDRRLE